MEAKEGVERAVAVMVVAEMVVAVMAVVTAAGSHRCTSASAC